MLGVVLSRRAQRDLRGIGQGETLERLRVALAKLSEGPSSLDVKPLTGAEPWLRLRVGDYRLILRPLDADEVAGSAAGWLVAGIVHRRDLERAVATLT